mmetsp:Transcript_3736/g.12098  ORF Transcript_3736/g.12098 Transcript_3736/m.12098 type:complete len:235 (+) Transcript_3736:545-1249(+)
MVDESQRSLGCERVTGTGGDVGVAVPVAADGRVVNRFKVHVLVNAHQRVKALQGWLAVHVRGEKVRTPLIADAAKAVVGCPGWRFLRHRNRGDGRARRGGSTFDARRRLGRQRTLDVKEEPWNRRNPVGPSLQRVEHLANVRAVRVLVKQDGKGAGGRVSVLRRHGRGRTRASRRQPPPVLLVPLCHLVGSVSITPCAALCNPLDERGGPLRLHRMAKGKAAGKGRGAQRRTVK